MHPLQNWPNDWASVLRGASLMYSENGYTSYLRRGRSIGSWARGFRVGGF
jgi:hypothetical protein